MRRRRGGARFLAALGAIVFGVLALSGAAFVLTFRLWWSALGILGLASLAAGLSGVALGFARAAGALRLGAALLLVPPLVRAVVARGAEDFFMTTLPAGGGTRFVNTLVPEREGSLLAAGMLEATGRLDDEEASDLRMILERAYERVDVGALRLPTPAIATYLGMQQPSGFDAIVIESPPGESAPASPGAVVFLHGYAGNFYVYCWEFAQAARAANLLTICPSLDEKGEWWTPRGDETFRATLAYLRARGIERVYLAGLSNGAAGASVLALRHEAKLSGLVLVSGTRAPRPPALPVLVVQGARDRMMPAALARAYAASGRRVRYDEVPGGHFVFLSHYEVVRPAVTEFLRSTEAVRSAAPRPAPSGRGGAGKGP